MRRLAAAAALLLIAAILIAFGREPATLSEGRLLPAGRLLIVVAPEPVVKVLFSGNPSALGVSPPGRSAGRLFDEIGAGAPVGDVTSRRPGTLGALGEALMRNGVSIDFAVPSLESNPLIQHALDAFAETGDGRGLHGPESLHPPRDIGVDLLVLTARTAGEVTATPAWTQRPAIMALGVPADLSTPVLVTVRRAGATVLGGGSTRRPGVATAADVSATVLEHFGVPRPAGFTGRPLRAMATPDDPSLAGSLHDRLSRDHDYAQSLTVWTIVAGFGLGVLGPFLLHLAGRGAWILRGVTGGAFATAGFLAGMFVPSSRGDVRALPLLALFVAGAAIAPRDRIRTAATAIACTGAATAAIAIVAALRPAGEPALSFWGNPLVSSRFTGLQNFQASFLAAGVLGGAVALGARPWILAAVAAAALLVAGAPALGANYVGVLTLSFGATIAVCALRVGAVKPAHFAVAAAVAAVAFAVALAADAGSASTHGGAAAREVSSGGASAALDLTYDRLRLNVRAIRAFPGGVAWAVALAAFDAWMIRWAMHDRTHALRVRAAVAACAAAGLAALALEDSGFKTGAVMSFPAMTLWALCVLGPRRPGVTAPAARLSPGGGA